jgi:hypothetical protein
MANVIVEPEERGTFAERQNERFVARSEAQAEAVEKAHDLRPNDGSVEAESKNGDLDKFRHLFGPKRRGDSGARRLWVPD